MLPMRRSPQTIHHNFLCDKNDDKLCIKGRKKVVMISGVMMKVCHMCFC